MSADAKDGLLARIAELEARSTRAEAALRTARVLMENSGHWRNGADYMTDAALWIERAQQALSSISGGEGFSTSSSSLPGEAE